MKMYHIKPFLSITSRSKSASSSEHIEEHTKLRLSLGWRDMQRFYLYCEKVAIAQTPLAVSVLKTNVCQQRTNHDEITIRQL